MTIKKKSGKSRFVVVWEFRVRSGKWREFERIYGLNGDWEVENHGIAPDVAVEDLPADEAAGHDRQLETGVQMVLDELKAHPIPEITIPPYPNYHKNDGLGLQ